MPYQKTTWVDGGPPPLSAENLNKLETQYDAVKTELAKTDGTSDIKPAAVNVLIQDAASNFASTNVEDALQELAGNVQAGKNTVASAITAMGQSASGTETFDSLASKIRAISTDATAAVADVLAGKTFYAGGSKKTGSMPNRGAVVLTPGASNVAIPAGYHNGSGYVVGDPDLVPANIRKGVSIFGITGALPVVPWFYDFSAYSAYANWYYGVAVPGQSTIEVLNLTGPGWLTFLAVLNSNYDSRQVSVVVDGVTKSWPVWTDYTGRGVLVSQPIRFENSLKVRFTNNATAQRTYYFAHTYMLQSGVPDDTKHAILDKTIKTFKANQHSLSVTGSGYLLAFSHGGTSTGEHVNVPVQIDGVTLATPTTTLFMALGPVRFSTSLYVGTPGGWPWKEVLYVLD